MCPQEDVEVSQQNEVRRYPELNAAIDNLNDKIYRMRRDLDSLMVLHNLLLAYLQNKLTKEEVKRLQERFQAVSNQRIEKFASILQSTCFDEQRELVSLSRMVQNLEQGRWDEE